MGKTTFSGPLRTGQNTGAPSTTTIGTLPATQACTVSVNARKGVIVVPDDVQFDRITAYVTQVVSGSSMAAGVNIRVGVSAREAKYATIPVSAMGVYEASRVPANCSAIAWMAAVSAGLGDTAIITIDATAQASAADWEEFEAVVQVSYIQRS